MAALGNGLCPQGVVNGQPDFPLPAAPEPSKQPFDSTRYLWADAVAQDNKLSGGQGATPLPGRSRLWLYDMSPELCRLHSVE